MAASTTGKVPIYSVNDLKSTTDDAIAPYLTTLPHPFTFAQDHSRTNVRFAIGYTAVSLAAFTFYADRKLGWEATRSPWIAVAVIIYFTLNSFFTYWLWAVESGEVFRGKRKTGEMISFRSSSKRHSPFYKLHVKYISSKKVLQEKDIEAKFTKWFSADGVFHPQPFRQWLASEVEILGLAARENIKRTGGMSSVVGS